MLKQGSLQQKFSYNEVGEALKHLRHREPERTFTKELVQVGLLDPAKPQRLYRKAWREVEEFKLANLSSIMILTKTIKMRREKS